MAKKILSLLLILFALGCVFAKTLNIADAVAANKATTFEEEPHWSKSPIDVYIPQNSYQQTMRSAFQRWQKDSFDKLKFRYVDKGPADIDVVFTDDLNNSDGPISSYSLTIQGKAITKAEIKIATESKDINKYSKDYIFTTMLHEVGHAIGLSDEPRKNASIMSMPISEKQDILKSDIRRLYKINNWSYMDRRINSK